jgi:S1-C subfamily serine protease
VPLLVALLIALVLPGSQTVLLRITVTVKAGDGSVRPVPRHALLISDDPVTTSPHRFVTRNDGVVEAYLKPGKYVVESDNPFVFEGKMYEWEQPVTVAPTSDTTLALTSANATIESAKPGAADSPAIAEAAAEIAEDELLTTWQDSVVTIWTPKTLGRGFLVDARGLIATNQRLIGKETTVEVQLSPTKKIAGRVVATDITRNVAVIWVDPHALDPAKPMKAGYAQDDAAAVKEHEKVYSVEGRAGVARNLVSGEVDHLTPRVVSSNVPLGLEEAGAPLFTASGAVVAITTAPETESAVNEISPRAVRIDDARSALGEAGKKIEGATPPPAALLPVEPASPFPEDALTAAAKTRRANLSPYLVSASDFDVNIITPPMLYASLHQAEDRSHFDYGRDDPSQSQPVLHPLDDFDNWREYVAETPAVILIRVTPKFGEKLWATVARGAAQTQGVAIPAIKRPKAVFGSLHLACGQTNLAPIHPFHIEHRLDATTSLDEGLYVYDASAISPQCGAVTITVFSDKPGDKGDARAIDAKIVQQVWDDFAPYRAASK